MRCTFQFAYNFSLWHSKTRNLHPNARESVAFNGHVAVAHSTFHLGHWAADDISITQVHCTHL